MTMTLELWQLTIETVFMSVTATLSLLCGVVSQDVYSFVCDCMCICEYLPFVFISCCDFMYVCLF